MPGKKVKFSHFDVPMNQLENLVKMQIRIILGLCMGLKTLNF